MGRKSKLTDELQAKIIERLQAGTTVKSTCDSVGIGESTYYDWLAIGNAYLDDESHARMPHKVVDRERYSAFAESTTRAIADGLVHATIRFRQGMNPSESTSHIVETYTETRLRTITKPDGTKEQVPYEYTRRIVKEGRTESPGDWRAARDYLARRDPVNWGKTEKLEHTGKDGGAIILKSGMDFDEL